MPRDEQWRREFTYEVAVAVMDSAQTTAEPGEPLPDAAERLHEALFRFYDKCERDPEYFRDVPHGVGWVLATYRNLRLWAGPSLDVTLDEAYTIPAAPPPALQPPAASPDPGDVICQYFFASPTAPRTGRLGLSDDAIAVVQWIAEFGIVQPGQRVPTHVWNEIATELNLTNDAAQDLYQRARLAFAVLYYVVGALGPPGTLASVDALDEAIRSFQRHFRGQREWSILKFAAHAAVPHDGGYAQVSAPLYAGAIRSNAAQAKRLGWAEHGPAPAVLLDQIEHQAAAVFGTPTPHCVLADDAGTHHPHAPHHSDDAGASTPHTAAFPVGASLAPAPTAKGGRS